MGQETLRILETLRGLVPDRGEPAGGIPYPQTDFGYGLRQVSMLVKAQAGLEAAAIDLGGWDTHFAQGAASGQMARLLTDLAQGLAAFHADLRDHMHRMTVVVMSEFGRRVQENASLGTDHGHGSLMMLMGGNVVGGKVHGRWPGLEDEQLFGPGDLAVTVDYRDVLGEICLRRLNNPALQVIFPGHEIKLRGYVVA